MVGAIFSSGFKNVRVSNSCLISAIACVKKVDSNPFGRYHILHNLKKQFQ